MGVEHLLFAQVMSVVGGLAALRCLTKEERVERFPLQSELIDVYDHPQT